MKGSWLRMKGSWLRTTNGRHRDRDPRSPAGRGVDEQHAVGKGRSLAHADQAEAAVLAMGAPPVSPGRG